MRKQKVHYANKFACDVACNLILFRSGRKVPKTAFNKRRVTCKRCKKTLVYRNKKVG